MQTTKLGFLLALISTSASSLAQVQSKIGKETGKRSGGTLRLCIAAMMLAACFDVPAQYTIKWHVIGGGGGVGAAVNLPDGNYSVNVTIGDPLAGSSQGGTHTLSSGFLSLLHGQQTPEEAPELRITRTPNRVVVSWPLPATGWVLDRTSALAGASTAWTEVFATYETNSTHAFVTLPIQAENTFFRLRKP